MEEELHLGKVTIKFALKFILWTILFFIIGVVIVGIASGGAIANMDGDINSIDDAEELFGAINGFIYGLVAVDIVSALLATKLSTGGIAKKNKINSESRPQIVKRIAIVLVILAVIIIVIHSVIVKAIDSLIVKDIGADSLSEVIDEAEDESDKVGDMFGISAEDEYEDAIKLLKGLNTAGNIYSISGLIFVAMIPVANLFLSKKEEQ